MTALGDNLCAPVRPASVALRRHLARSMPASHHSHNGLTACRMRSHMASAAPGPRGPCGPRRPLRHSGHTPAPTPTGDYAPSLRSPWRAAVACCKQHLDALGIDPKHNRRIATVAAVAGRDDRCAGVVAHPPRIEPRLPTSYLMNKVAPAVMMDALSSTASATSSRATAHRSARIPLRGQLAVCAVDRLY
jgi:hypothetical protein